VKLRARSYLERVACDLPRLWTALDLSSSVDEVSTVLAHFVTGNGFVMRVATVLIRDGDGL
jgi:hypothetical protein